MRKLFASNMFLRTLLAIVAIAPLVVSYQNCGNINMLPGNPSLILPSENGIAPSGIDLSNDSVAENLPAGSIVGTISVVDSDSISHSLMISDSTATFEIEGSSLILRKSLNYEAKSSFNISITAVDSSNNSYTAPFMIAVVNAPDEPSAIFLNTTTLVENAPNGTIVSDIQVLDEDSASHTITISGTDIFSIDGHNLVVADSSKLDYEERTAISFFLRATDESSLYINEAVTIYLIDVDEGATGINLSANRILENSPSGTVIGSFSATGILVGDVSYELLSQQDLFIINGSQLATKTAGFNYESTSSYAISVKATDQSGGAGITNTFTIDVENVDEGATNVLLSGTSISENSSPGTTVGNLSATGIIVGTLSYELLNQQNLFAINNATLVTAPSSAFDYESQSSYDLSIKVVDQSGEPGFTKSIRVNITDIDEGPSNIVLSGNTISEDSSSGTVVGNLSATGLIIGDLTYELLSGGSLFEIDGAVLKTATGSQFDFETASSHSITIKGSDNSGEAPLSKSFTITVTDVDESPSGLTFEQSPLLENSPVGTLAGVFSVTDPHSESHTITITGTSAFEISSKNLLVSDPSQLDFESSSSISFSATAESNDGETITKSFTVNIGDVDEGPSNISLTNSSIPENSSPGTFIGAIAVSGQIVGGISLQLFDVSGFFEISGSNLVSSASGQFDFETTASYPISIKATDQSGEAPLTRSFTINVSDVNEAPTNLEFSPQALLENSPIGTLAGEFTVTDPSSSNHSISITGSSAFSVSGNQLLVADSAQLDFETASSMAFTATATNETGGVISRNFSISIGNVDEGPNFIAPVQFVVFERSPAGTVLAELTAGGPIVGNVTFTLLDQQDKFEIVGSELRIKNSDNIDENISLFEVIEVSAEDESGEAAYETMLLGYVNSPRVSEVLLSNSSVDENSSVGTLIGELSSTLTSPFEIDVIYEFQSDYPEFRITGNRLEVNVSDLDYEHRTEYSITVKAHVVGYTSYKYQTFVIQINDLDDSPEVLLTGERTLKEYDPAYTLVGMLSLSYEDPRFPDPYFRASITPYDARTYLQVYDGHLEVAPQYFGQLQVEDYSFIDVQISAYDKSYYEGNRKINTQTFRFDVLPGDPPIITPESDIHFLLDTALLADQTREEIKANLVHYVEGINHVFGKNTVRTYSFDPENNIEYYQHESVHQQPSSYGVSPGYSTVIQLCLDPDIRSASAINGRPHINELRVIDSTVSEIPPPGTSGFGLRLYMMLHELGHHHRLGLGEYYAMYSWGDSTGVLPDLSFTLVDPDDYYYSRRTLTIHDPMQSHLLAHADGRELPDLLTAALFSPMGAVMIDKTALWDYDDPCPEYEFKCGMNVDAWNDPNIVEIKVRDASSGQPIDACLVTAYWTTKDKSTNPWTYPSGVLDSIETNPLGIAEIELGLYVETGSRMIWFFKANCAGYEPGGDALSRFDLEGRLHAPNGVGFTDGWTSEILIQVEPTP